MLHVAMADGRCGRMKASDLAELKNALEVEDGLNDVCKEPNVKP